jgi:phage FluMu protein Com
MIEVMIQLGFTCVGCSQPIRVKLRCAGSKHTLTETVATIHVPCPTCMRLNRVCFDGQGTIHTVEAVYDPQRVPTPSVN